MLTHRLGGVPISYNDLLEEIEDGTVKFVVAGFSPTDLGDIDNFNELCLDEAVENGYLLMDVSYDFYSIDPSDKTASILVKVADTSEFEEDEK